MMLTCHLLSGKLFHIKCKGGIYYVSKLFNLFLFISQRKKITTNLNYPTIVSYFIYNLWNIKIFEIKISTH